jgi:hypothetical protein
MSIPSLDLFSILLHNSIHNGLSRFQQIYRSVKCPAEESANLERSLPINARKNCEKTDIRANNLTVFDKQPGYFKI